MTTFYVDVAGGATGDGTGSSFANKAATIQGVTTAAFSDVIRIMGSPDPTSLSQNATFTNKSKTVTLTTAVTANIDLCNSNWTASANVTSANTGAGSGTTLRKEGSGRIDAIITGAFTTGLAAYFATGTLDLSTYQQISFWVQSDTAIAASAIKICTCSDTVGAVIVNTATVTRAINAGRWTKVTVNTGGNLGASIASVALYVITDLGAGTVNVYLDNILACKSLASADSLTLQSMIGKNGAGTGSDTAWYPIKSINGTTVIIDMDTNNGATTGLGYAGTTEAVTCSKLETIKTASQSSSSGTVQNPATSGTSAGQITLSGGWDTTNMSSQSLQASIFDGLDGNGYGLFLNGKTYITIDKVGFCNYFDGMHIQGTTNNILFNNVPVCSGNTNNGIFTNNSSTSNCTFTAVSMTCNTSGGMIFTGSATTGVHFIFNGAFVSNSNTTYGIYFNGVSVFMPGGSITTNNNDVYGIRLVSPKPCTFKNITSKDNGSYNFDVATQVVLGDHKIYGYTSSGSGVKSINFDSLRAGNLYFYNMVATDSTKMSTFAAGTDARVYSQLDGGTVDNNIIYMDSGQIATDSTTIHGATNIAWKLSPTATTRDAYYPIQLSIAKIAVNANSLVTFGAWLRRDNSTISHQIRIPASLVAGVNSGGNDIVVTETGTTSTWAQVQSTFTPTASGVIEVFYEVWDGTGTTRSGWVSDLSYSQA